MLNHRARPVSAWLVAATLCWALCPRPATAKTIEVNTGADLQATLAAAVAGDVVRLAPGVYRGNFVLGDGVTLSGPRDAVLDGGGTGSVVRVDGIASVLEGVSIRNSGDDLGARDAGVLVTKAARGAIVRRLHIDARAFGVWMHENPEGKLLDNEIEGSRTGRRPDRGNGIQLFDCSKVQVRGNVVRAGRDGIYVEATDDSVIEHNRFEETRYAIHYMYSHRNFVRGNIVRNNFSGIALMFSRDITVEDNLAEDNHEAGLFLNSLEGSTIRRNRALRNVMGLFFYGCSFNTLTDNEVRDNEIGTKIWAGSTDNLLTNNVFANNRTQVFYISTRDLTFGEEQPGNYYSDYMGWDQNGDGIGDRPYRVDSFTTSIVHQFPIAALLLRSPALELLSHLEQRMPLLRVPTVVDLRPRMRGPSAP